MRFFGSNRPLNGQSAVAPHRAALACFALLALMACAITLRPSIRGNDGVQNYVYLRSLLCDGNLDFENEYAHYAAAHPEWFDNRPVPRDPVTQRPVNLYGVGSSLLWSPWVLCAHGYARLRGGPADADGYARPYEAAVGIGSCIHASAGLVLLLALLLRYAAPGAALRASMLAWLASPLVMYMYFHPSMSHANSFLLAVLLAHVYLGDVGGWSARRWAVLGGLFGLLVLTRFQDAALGAFLAAGEIHRLAALGDRPRPWAHVARAYMAFVLAAVVCFSPQFFAWNAIHGSPLSGPRGYLSQGTISPLLPAHLLDVLFSPRHGLFLWHPGLIACVAGLAAARVHARERIACVAAFAATWYVVSCWSIWWAGASFGHRMFISTLPFLAFGAAMLAPARRPARWAVNAALALLIVWNAGLLVQYGTGMIPRQDAVPVQRMVSNNLVEVPRLVAGWLAGERQP